MVLFSLMWLMLVFNSLIPLLAGPYKCYHWSSADIAKINDGQSELDVCSNKGPGFRYTRGDESLAPGCGSCHCCQTNYERYKCYHWTAEDKANIAKRGEEVDYCYQKGAGFRHTRGDNSKAPGCGSCWCCQPDFDRYQCYHWNEAEKKRIKGGEDEVKVCHEKGPLFRHTRGNDSLAPGCGTCWCCQSKHDRYKCYHWNADEKKRIAGGENEVDICFRKGPGFIHTRGDDSKAPGCGSCWCCQPDNTCH